MTIRYASENLGLEYAEMTAFEHGRHLFDHGKVAAMLDLYRVYDDVELDRLLGLARAAFRLPRWEGDFDAPAVDVSVLDFLWLESNAERICCYGATLVPDLLRTPNYAEAVVCRDRGLTVADEHVRWWVRVHRDRQRDLDAAASSTVQGLIAEPVLHRLVGGADTLRDQHEHLAKLGAGGRVEVRVLPLTAGYLPGMDGSFTVFEMPQPYPRVVACTPRLDGMTVHEGPAARWCAAVFDRLCAAALPPSRLPLTNERNEGGH